MRGRLIQLHPPLIANLTGTHALPQSGAACLGDLVEWTGQKLRVLTPNRSGGDGQAWLKRVLDPRRQKGVRVRRQVEDAIRAFFRAQDFFETRTPLLVPCPGMEPHIRPFRAGPRGFLPTSPEFAMKRLLVGGLERIFQLSPAFRAEPESRTHHPEFTMLEWYRAYAGYEAIMADTEALIEHLARTLFGEPIIPWQGQRIDVRAPWPRLRVRDLMQEHAGVDLVRAVDAAALARECARLGLITAPGDTWDDLFFRIWLNCVEPRLPADRAVLVTRYPKSQAALAVVDRDPDGSEWARRFEVFAGGLELGNAFEELTDPVEQRARFEKDMALRARTYGAEFPVNPLDEEFLAALAEGMPPAGGIAVGVDRLVMLCADESDIDYTLWLKSFV
jgi:lysyl-tRNA synthetase class 2